MDRSSTSDDSSRCGRNATTRFDLLYLYVNVQLTSELHILFEIICLLLMHVCRFYFIEMLQLLCTLFLFAVVLPALALFLSRHQFLYFV